MLAVFMLFGFAAYMIWDQFHWWSTREDYSFGYLVPFFVAYIIYDRWPLIQGHLALGQPGPIEKEPVRSKLPLQTKLLEWLAYSVFLIAIALFAIGALLRAVTGPQNPASLAIASGFSGLLLSTVFIVFKERADGQPMSLKSRLAFTGLFLFPSLIWLLSAPMVSVLETKIRVFLLTKVTIVVFNLFDIMGFELDREGNILILPNGRVGVEEACSGIRSLTACLFAGTFLASVFLDRFWKKALLVIAAMGFAVVTNLMRSLFLTAWAYFYDAGAINETWHLPLIGEIGTVHDVTGFAILGVTCVGLILLLPIFNFKLKAFDDPSESGPPVSEKV